LPQSQQRQLKKKEKHSPSHSIIYCDTQQSARRCLNESTIKTKLEFVAKVNLAKRQQAKKRKKMKKKMGVERGGQNHVNVTVKST